MVTHDNGFVTGGRLMIKQKTIGIHSRKRTQWVDITNEVQRIVSESNVQNGICTVASLHTTGGVTINENADPDVERDFFNALAGLVSQDPSFHHSEGNSDAHIDFARGIERANPGCEWYNRERNVAVDIFLRIRRTA
jgi:hypothetical protein